MQRAGHSEVGPRFAEQSKAMRALLEEMQLGRHARPAQGHEIRDGVFQRHRLVRLGRHDERGRRVLGDLQFHRIMPDQLRRGLGPSSPPREPLCTYGSCIVDDRIHHDRKSGAPAHLVQRIAGPGPPDRANRVEAQRRHVPPAEPPMTPMPVGPDTDSRAACERTSRTWRGRTSWRGAAGAVIAEAIG